MSKSVTATISISTDTRVQGRYFIDVRDTTAGRNRQMTTKVTSDPAPFLAKLEWTAAEHGVEVTVTDTTGELSLPQAAPANPAPAAPADDLDSKKFPELMDIAKLHNVPGRGTARRQQLIDGIRAARGEADAAFRRALSAPGAVHTPQPVTAPAVLPGRAAPALVWSRRRELSGRYDIHTRKRGSSTEYRGVGGGGRQPIGHWHRRLSDAQAEVQCHHEDLHRAHNTAAAMEAARVAGDPLWGQLDAQMLAALAEDARRTRPVAARPAKPLSPLGELAAAYRKTHTPVR